MPDWRPDIRARLSQLSIAPSREAEIVEELTQHLDDRWHELMAKGQTPDDAARIARTEFNGARLEALLGTLRQAHWHETPPPGPSRAFSLDSVFIDLRHAIRALRATPSFTIGALLVLALGTGATTAIFSVVDAVALRPLPFPAPDRIVAVGIRADAAVGGGSPRPGSGPRPMAAMPGAKPPDPDTLMNVTSQEYLGWVDRQQVFESMAAINDMGDAVLQPPNGEPELVKGQRVTASFFDVLRARPLLGAVFTSANEIAGSDHVVVVSHGFWQRHFSADPTAVNRTFSLNGESYTIVGVMPPGFAYPPGSPQPADLWTPWVPDPQARVRAGGARALGGALQSIARRRPDVTLEHARAQMVQVAAAIAADNPTANTRRSIGIRPLRDHLVGSSTRSWMLMLLAAVAIVLLIACANVANLWLARASVQQRDTAVRAALGASRGRLAQRVLIESLIVSVAGTIVGLALAWFCVRVLAAALPENVVRIAAIGIDARVLAVAVLAALVTGLVSGIAPALQGSNPASSVLNESARGGGTSRGRRRVRAVLVVAEVALAVVLLVGAALFIGSFVNVLRIDPGFRAEGVLAAQVIQPASPGSPQVDVRPALADIVDRARQLPGVVEAAAAAPGIPFRINLRIGGLQAPGQPLDYNMTVSEKVVTPGYHRTLAIPLRSGRYFTDDDREGAEAVVIFSDAAARMFFGSDDPLGRIVIVVGKGERRVVGVVANARQASLEVSPHPEVYVPLTQGASQSYGFVLLHTSGNPNTALPALRAVVAQVLPGVPLRQVARLEDLMAAQTAERRLSMLMFSLFGFLGLVISAVGIFSVIAYLVSQQTRDIGIRMALGATQSRVVAAVFGQVGRLVAAGLMVGGFVAWSLSNATGRFLFGLDPRDARAYAVAMITLVAAAFLATLLPARRAASIDPTQALRHE